MRDLNFALDLENTDEGGNKLKNENYSVRDATAAVKKAEESKLQEDIDAARELVSALEDSEEKTALQERLSTIEVKEEEIKEPETDNEVVEEPVVDHEEVDGEDSEEGEDTDSEEEEEEETEPEEEPEEEEEESVVEDNTDDGAEKKKLEFEALQSEFEALQTQFNEINEKYKALLEEKNNYELELKEEVCDKFSILGEEVIADFKGRLEEFSVEELDKELSVLAFKKGLTFNLIEDTKDVLITRHPEAGQSNNTPAWAKAIKKKENI